MASSVQQEDSKPGSLAEQPSPLLRLPAELREQIYRYVVISSEPITVSRYFPSGIRGLFHRVVDNPKDPPLTCTCHQIRLEALAIFYSENIFEDPSQLSGGCGDWLLKLVPAKQAMLREVRLMLPTSFEGDAQLALDEFRSRLREAGGCLESEAIFVRQHVYGDEVEALIWSRSPGSDFEALSPIISRLDAGDSGETWRVMAMG